MPFTSDDGTDRQARFESDGSISSWGGGERAERWTPEPRERKEPRETEYRETEHREAARREVERKEAERREVERKELTKHTKPEKTLVDKIIDKTLGATQGSCYQKQEALARGAARAEVLTLGMCVGAALAGGANVPADVGCLSGIGVCAVTETASEVWKGHCSTLPFK